MKTDNRIVSRHRARIAAMQVVFAALSGVREDDETDTRDNAGRALKRLLEAPFVENAACKMVMLNKWRRFLIPSR